jgi:hypothetical protein
MSSTAQSAESIKVIRFDGKNFSLWKMKIMALLEAWDLLEVVEKPAPVDSQITATSSTTESKREEKQEELVKKAKKAYATLINCLPDEQLSLVRHVPRGDAHQVWNTLVQRYERNTTANKAHTRDMLHKCKKESKESVDAYLARVMQLVMSLNEMNEKVSEGELMYVLFNGLPSEYDSVVQSLKVNEQIKFDDACKHIRDHEEVMKIKHSNEEEIANHVKESIGEHAYGIFRGNGMRGRGHPKRGRGTYTGRGGRFGSGDNRECFACGKVGHIAANCGARESAQSKTKSCDHCKKPGHTIQECYFLKRDKERKDEELYYAFNAFTHHDHDKQIWVLDSGASRHMCNDINTMHDVNPISCDDKRYAILANNERVNLKQTGKTKIGNILLEDVVHTPQFAANLLSVARIVDNVDGEITFTRTNALVKDNEGTTVVEVPRVGNLYLFEQALSVDEQTINIKEKEEQTLWHNRLGHISVSSMKKLKDANAVDGIEVVKMSLLKDSVCEACQLGKAHRKPFANYTKDKVETIMDRVHADLCGPMRVESLAGYKYLSTIIDERSRRIVAQLIRNKSDAAEGIINWCKQAAVETAKPLKVFHCDGGGEYKSSKLLEYFRSVGTVVNTTLPSTPQHNGIAERVNRTLLESARAMLKHSGLPDRFWGEAVLTAIYIRNRCVTTVDTSKTPEEIWKGKRPTIKYMKVFGCDAYVHIKDAERGKLDSKAKKCIFIGYDEQKKGYKLFDTETEKIIVSRDVTFDEMKFTLSRSLGNSDHSSESLVQEEQEVEPVVIAEKKDSEEKEILRGNSGESVSENSNQAQSDEVEIGNIYPDLDSDVNSDESDEKEVIVAEPSTDPVVPNRARLQLEKGSHHRMFSGPASSKRVRFKPTRYGMVDYRQHFDHGELGFAVLEEFAEPATYREAVEGKEARFWKQAMKEEMNSHKENNTWTLAKLPEGRKTVGSKWIFKKKIGKDGQVERYKARLCAKGYTQEKGIDYNETFAPVLKYKSMRIILSLVAIRDLELKQMDVQTAFLNAEIKEEVFMEQAEGFEQGGADVVCKLNKTIYGTKQAPNEWNSELSNFIESILGFNRCVSDTCIYTKGSRTGNTIIIGVFVDDILIAYELADEDEWERYKRKFMDSYKMKDLGEAEWILGMRVTRNRREKSIVLDQEVYITKLLDQFNMADSKPVSTPADISRRISNTDSPATPYDIKQMQNIPYRSLVGALMYAAISTRPDIAQSVNLLSRYMTNPGMAHWMAGKRILRYLNGSRKMGLHYDGNRQPLDKSNYSVQVKAYADADWGGDLDGRKSTTGYIIMINGCVVSWVSRKQSTVALSTAEAEYMAISATLQDIKWLTQLLDELNYKQTEIPLLYTDNKAAIAISENDVNHSRAKHIDIRHHFVRDAIKRKELRVEWIDTRKQIADINTKALSGEVFTRLRDKIMKKREN